MNELKIKFFCVLVILFLFVFAAAQKAQSQVQPNKFDISLKNNSAAESQTKEQLERLINIYDISKWTFTYQVMIDENSTPHSHPVLTLSTRHLKDDELLLSTFVHEQLHWFLIEKSEAMEKSLKELQTLFPKVPVTRPEGSNDERSTYLHLLVNYFEYRAMKLIVGELRARQIMDFWTTDHYTWIYKTVLERGREIGTIAFNNKLIPPALERPKK